MLGILKSRMAKKVAIISSLAAVTLFIGHGCSGPQGATNSNNSSSSVPVGSTGGNDGMGQAFAPIPGVNTVSLVYNKQLVDNMVICSGIGTASVPTMDEWEKRQSSFSEYGYALDVTAPMMMAVAAFSGEICNDLLNLETALPPASRRVFNSFDFTRGPAAIDSIAVADAARRMARSCWARNEEAAELQIINEEITLALTQGRNDLTDGERSRAIALMLCSGMLASLSGITL